jgi:hypothetical protein
VNTRHVRGPHNRSTQTNKRTLLILVCSPAQVIASSNGVEVEYQLPAAAHVRATLHDAVGGRSALWTSVTSSPGYTG